MLNIKGRLQKERIFLKKELGQNFLLDENILRRIVTAAEVGSEDTVLEIGAGLGNLTVYLAKEARRVLAVEVDKRMVGMFKKTVPDDAPVELIVDDIMKLDLEALLEEFAGKVKVVANLPYLISTPVIFRLLEHRRLFSSFTLMLQKELADRLAAKPGGKDYGALTVNVRPFVEVRSLFTVPPQVFFPRPRVASRVVRFDLLAEPRFGIEAPGVFRQVVQAAFNQRRKMLGNALKSFAGGATGEVLAEAGIDPQRRGETLSPEEFARIANLLATKLLPAKEKTEDA